MKYLKSYNESLFSVRKEGINKLCKQYAISNYTINDDLTVDVNGDVNLYKDYVYWLDNNKIDYLPLQFNKISGSFIIDQLNLKSLKGCPNYVGGVFNCSHNELESLEFGPKYVESGYYASHNNLTTLKHIEGITTNTLDVNINFITNINKEQIKFINLNEFGGIGYNPFQIFIEILQEKKIFGDESFNDWYSNSETKIEYLKLVDKLEEFEVIKNDNIIDMISLNSLFDYYNIPFDINEEYIESKYNDMQRINKSHYMAFNKFYTFS